MRIYSPSLAGGAEHRGLDDAEEGDEGGRSVPGSRGGRLRQPGVAGLGAGLRRAAARAS